ncbi:MAG: tRNA (N6-isopentenyl adenosine(37)-C2)-methylthiotransferase MiaB [Patescibacteria group bacterium]
MIEAATKPKFRLVTFGCQMNKNDSERIAGLLSGLGFVSTESDDDADLILYNTCSVRQSAEDRIFGKMEDLIALKEKKPNVIVAVTGCMPGRDKTGEFRKKMPAVDLYFPTPEMVKLPRWIAELRPDLVNSADLEADYLKLSPLRVPSAQAFVTIQTGCNKFCTYCVVPYARGLERNRPVADVLQEVRELAAHGVIEITLLGQTVNSFKASDPESFSTQNPYTDSFAALLWEVNNIDGVERVHWTAPHPNSMTDEVIDALNLPKQVNYLHLPVQAGSNDVLFRMNRKYTREKFLEVIEKVKAKRPGIALGTDIIVGFPGETAEQFDETVSLYQACGFDISYTAQYSPRSGTLGVKLFKDDVSREEKRRRWDVLQALMEQTVLWKNKRLEGSVKRVLVERVENGLASGNSEDMKLTRFHTNDASLVGKIVPVKIVEALEWQLKGDLVS